METKICKACNKELPLTSEYFYNDKTTLSGFRGKCKECLNAYGKEYKKNNKEAMDIYRKKWCKENEQHIKQHRIKYLQDNKEKTLLTKRKYYKENEYWVKEYPKNYYEENKEWIKEKAKIYRGKNKNKIAKKTSQWQKDNTDKVNIITQRYIAKKAKLPFTLTSSEWDNIKKDFGGKCAYCGISEADHLEKWDEVIHQEHFIALSKGGEFTHNNIIPSCKKCNASKGSKDFFEWYPRQGYYNKNREKFILEYLNYTTEDTQQLALFR